MLKKDLPVHPFLVSWGSSFMGPAVCSRLCMGGTGERGSEWFARVTSSSESLKSIRSKRPFCNGTRNDTEFGRNCLRVNLTFRLYQDFCQNRRRNFAYCDSILSQNCVAIMARIASQCVTISLLVAMLRRNPNTCRIAKIAIIRNPTTYTLHH